MNPFLDDPVARPPATVLPAGRAAAPRQNPASPSGRWRRVAGRWVLAASVGMAGNVLAAPAPATALNLNIATAAQLESVKGIGPKTAALIVSERERAGPFTSFQDFAERVRGIGPKRAAALRAQGLGVSSAPAAGSVRP